jgi:hypothetical protein
VTTKRKRLHDAVPKDTQLFAPDIDPQHNACLTRVHLPWGLYADGYRRAAELLIEHCETFYEKNTLVYPIVFLYRQYIELRLKDIVRESKQVVEKPSPPLQHHKLDALWPVCRSIIQERDLPVSTEDLSRIESCIKQFREFDPTSEAFRYPETKQGGLSLPPHLEKISLRGLADAMKSLAGSLENISHLLSADVDLENEFRRDLYPEG